MLCIATPLPSKHFSSPVLSSFPAELFCHRVPLPPSAASQLFDETSLKLWSASPVAAKLSCTHGLLSSSPPLLPFHPWGLWSRGEASLCFSHLCPQLWETSKTSLAPSSSPKPAAKGPGLICPLDGPSALFSSLGIHRTLTAKPPAKDNALIFWLILSNVWLEALPLATEKVNAKLSNKIKCLWPLDHWARANLLRAKTNARPSLIAIASSTCFHLPIHTVLHSFGCRILCGTSGKSLFDMYCSDCCTTSLTKPAVETSKKTFCPRALRRGHHSSTGNRLNLQRSCHCPICFTEVTSRSLTTMPKPSGEASVAVTCELHCFLISPESNGTKPMNKRTSFSSDLFNKRGSDCECTKSYNFLKMPIPQRLIVQITIAWPKSLCTNSLETTLTTKCLNA